MKCTAKQVFEKLVKGKITKERGQIVFHLAGTEIVVKQRDVVGIIIQEWLEGWLRDHNIEFATNPNTQMPPGLFLDPDNTKVNQMEVKAFNYKASPGFDIADFNMYQREIIEKPWMLNVDYLIFGYEMTDDGDVYIRNLWLKKVWEITRPMKGWPLCLQVKHNVVHIIRPAKWYGTKSKFNLFPSMEYFLSAIEECVYKNQDTRHDANKWKERMVASYKKEYKKKLSIPRWFEIEDELIKGDEE